VDFSEARVLFVNIFQILGPNFKFLDYRLILEKPRGLNAKCLKLEFPGIIFLKDTRGPRLRAREPGRACTVHCGTMTAQTEGARARRCAHRSTASGRSGAPQLTGGGAIEREEHGELSSGLTEAWAAAWRLGNVAA
jgi:hypothetical protein